MELLQGIQNSPLGEKTIIFSQFTSLLDPLLTSALLRNWEMNAQQDMEWETRRRTKKERKRNQRHEGGSRYLCTLCGPQARGPSPSLGCQGRTLTVEVEAVGAQQEGLQPVEGPTEGPRKASWAERRSRKRRITMKPMMELVLNL
jgi:hypothetical protein